MVMTTCHNYRLYANQTKLISPQGVWEPSCTDFHAPKWFAPALGRPGIGRFCMCTGVIPLQSGSSVTCLTLFAPNKMQVWTYFLKFWKKLNFFSKNDPILLKNFKKWYHFWNFLKFVSQIFWNFLRPTRDFGGRLWITSYATGKIFLAAFV